MYFAISVFILFVVLSLTVFALYKLIRMPGSHKLKYIEENNKLEEPVLLKTIFIIVAFIVFISILGKIFLKN